MDCVRETMPRTEAVRLHAACASTLGGIVPDSQLARHHESAGHDDQAARLFQRQAYRIRECGGDATNVSIMFKRALACVQRCEESAGSAELEMVLLLKLITTWTISGTEMAECTARFGVLRDGGFGADLGWQRTRACPNTRRVLFVFSHLVVKTIKTRFFNKPACLFCQPRRKHLGPGGGVGHLDTRSDTYL